MMRRKTTYTNITSIPSFIPRQLAIDILHSHGEVIELNPLVTGYEAIKAPRDAPADEFYSTWYEIAQRIQYIPGMGKYGSGAIKFRGVFHDMPWGLQTHIYAPAGVDLRNKWQICGNQPGEPAQTHEMGLGAPPEGLYLREDIEIRCNMTMVSFVKKETKAASKILVDRLIKKAELLDSGVLQGMMENGRLKTINPADRRSGQSQLSPRPSPTQAYQLPASPMSPTFQRRQSQHIPPNQLLGQNNIVMELPGDFYHPQPSPNLLHPSNRYSTASDDTSMPSPTPSNARWSQSQASHDNRSSVSSYATSDGGMRSPGLEQKGFTAELPTMDETREEHDQRMKSESSKPIQKYAYNPQDYAKIQQQQQHLQLQYQQPPQYSAFHPGR